MRVSIHDSFILRIGPTLLHTLTFRLPPRLLSQYLRIDLLAHSLSARSRRRELGRLVKDVGSGLGWDGNPIE